MGWGLVWFLALYGLTGYSIGWDIGASRGLRSVGSVDRGEGGSEC